MEKQNLPVLDVGETVVENKIQVVERAVPLFVHLPDGTVSVGVAHEMTAKDRRALEIVRSALQNSGMPAEKAMGAFAKAAKQNIAMLQRGTLADFIAAEEERIALDRAKIAHEMAILRAKK